jgi:hypothetical protein
MSVSAMSEEVPDTGNNGHFSGNVLKQTILPPSTIIGTPPCPSLYSMIDIDDDGEADLWVLMPHAECMKELRGIIKKQNKKQNKNISTPPRIVSY